MKRVAAGEDPHVTEIELVLGVRVVRVEPGAVIVPFEVEHLEVPVGIRTARSRPPRTLPVGPDMPADSRGYSPD